MKWRLSLTLNQCTLAGPVYTGMPLECHWLTQCTLRYHWATQQIEQGSLEHHWKNLIEIAPHWNATGVTLTIAAYTGTPLEGMQQITHTQLHIVKQSSIRASWKRQDGGTSSSKWTGLCKFSFYLEFTALQWISVLLFKRVSTSTQLCACLGYEHHYSFFVYLGFQFKWNQLLAIPVVYIKGLHAGKWPGPMTSRPDFVSTLEYHWTDYTGTHWLMISPSGLPVAIQRGATRTLGCHWNHTDWC